MCGRGSISYSAANIVAELRKIGVKLPDDTAAPAEYHVGSKSCEDKTKRNPTGIRGIEGWPCVLTGSDGALAVRTLTWGVQRLATHNIWLDGGEWLQRKTWREALEAGKICAVAVTGFAEGVTCRKPDGEHPLFFLAALVIGSHFVILTTNATRVPLRRSRIATRV